jgi:hypothetical protein
MSKEKLDPHEEDEEDEEDEYESSRDAHTPDINFKTLSKDASKILIISKHL